MKNLLIITILLVVGIFALKYIFIYFSPFIIAVIFASLIDPIVSWLDRKLPIDRGFSVVFVLGLSITIIVILIIFGVSQVYLELNRLLRNLPDYNALGNQFSWIIQQNNQVQEFINDLEISSSVKNVLNSNLEMIYQALRNGLVELINTVLGYISKLPLILTILFLSFIATFFISRDKSEINQYILRLFPQQWKTKVDNVRKELISSALGFIRAQLILISMTGLITGVGLTILGNQYALVLGISAAILDLIPIIGPALIFFPWILYNLILGEISHGISLLILYIILAAVRSGSEGKVMGENLGIYPLSTMIALYVGFRVLGTIGFILGPALLVIIKAIIQADLISIYEE